MKNPYWHEYIKFHVVDFDEVRELCFEAYSILEASHSMMGTPGEEVGGALHETFFRMAESKLSGAFLNIAVKIRTFEDIIADTPLKQVYVDLLEKAFDPGQIGSLGTKASFDRTDLTLREACNKIIHAEDFRPTYDNGSHSREEDFAWGMTGTIEIADTLRGKQWDVWLDSREFLNVCLEVANQFDPSPPEDT